MTERLADHTTLRVGGPADEFVRVTRRDELVGTLAVEATRGHDVFVLGGGSNLVVSDAGLRATVVQVAGGLVGRRSGPESGMVELTVDAGVGWDEFVEATVELGATGVELLSGIPGTVGAAPVQNVAAYGQQVCDSIVSVGTYDRATSTIEDLPSWACAFGYRTSRFKQPEWSGRIITHVVFRLHLADAAPPEASTYGDVARWFSVNGGDPRAPGDRRRAVLAVRASKSMVLDASDPMSRSAGSFFVNPEVPVAQADDLIDRFAAQGLDVHYLEGQRAADPTAAVRRIPAALVMRAAGFNPGDRWGPVQLSDKHVLAVVTHEGATADDVWHLTWLIRQRVHDETGLVLVPEPTFVGAFPEPAVFAFSARHAFVPGAPGDPAWLQR